LSINFIAADVEKMENKLNKLVHEYVLFYFKINLMQNIRCT